MSVLRNIAKSLSYQSHIIEITPYVFACTTKIPKENGTISQSRRYSTQSSYISLDAGACPQGVQGDVNAVGASYTDCPVFKQWLANCKRYGLSDCKDQLQGVQSDCQTVSQVLVERDHLLLLTDLLQNYEVVQEDRASSMQGSQDCVSAFPELNSPCPQGVQGDDCTQYKLWLENCYRFGYQDCLDQYQNFKAGRKTLQQIFAEQDRDIREAAILISRQRKLGRRNYSTSVRNYSTPASSSQSSPSKSDASPTSKQQQNENPEKNPEESEEAPLSQKDKLKRAVKEYGSTVIVFHVSISLMSLGFFYLLVSSGVDVVGLLRSAGIGESILQSKLAAGTGTFVVAYAVHKVFAPVRIATTLTATPLIVRYLRKIGVLKVKVPPKTS